MHCEESPRSDVKTVREFLFTTVHYYMYVPVLSSYARTCLYWLCSLTSKCRFTYPTLVFTFWCKSVQHLSSF